MPSPDGGQLAGLRISGTEAGDGEGCFRLEVRDPEGNRQPGGDLEVEIYRSGGDLHLMICRADDGNAPMLWHGRHPVWMDAVSGERCERPPDWGPPLEALARRLRALVAGE